MALKKPTMKPQREKKISSLSMFGLGKEKDYFFENLTMLIDAGMNLVTSLNALEEEVKAKQMKMVIHSMREEISAGVPLWRAMSHVQLLPPQMLYLVRLGEETGRLPQNLAVIVEQRDKDKNFKSKVRSAMIYPIIVISLTLVIGTGIAWFVLPNLTSVFSELDLDLPLITRVLIGFGNFLQKNGYFVVPIAFSVLIILVYFVFFFKKTKFIGQAILLHLPVIKSLMSDVEIARFGFVLGTLLEAGLPITRAMGSLRESTTVHSYQRLFEALAKNVEVGSSFQRSFETTKKIDRLLPTHIQHMIVAGEQSGSLPKTLRRIGEKYEEKVEETTRNLSVLIEPMLLFVVWIGVMMVALAVIMPIYSLIGQLHG